MTNQTKCCVCGKLFTAQNADLVCSDACFNRIDIVIKPAKPPTSAAQHLAALWQVEQDLASLINDAQTAAEQAPGAQFDDTNEAGEGIIYPENAAPDLDAARALVQAAIDAFMEGLPLEDEQRAGLIFRMNCDTCAAYRNRGVNQ